MAEDLLAALDAALSQNAEAWESTTPQTGSIYDPPPKGEYQAVINGFEFITWDEKPPSHSLPNGRPAGIALKVAYQITNSAEYAGRIVTDLMTISDPDRLPWLKGWLANMGVDTENTPLSALRPVTTGDGLLDKLLDTPVLIFVNHKQDKTGEWRVNTYLRRTLGEWGAGASGAGPGDGFTPRSDVTSPQEGFDFAPVSPGIGAIGGTPDDDIPF